MIQDILPYKLYNQYDKTASAEADDFALCFDDKSRILVSFADDTISFPKVSQVGCNLNYTYLFSVDDIRFFMPCKTTECFEGFDYLSLRDLRNKCCNPKHLLFAAYTGKHIADWYRDTKFCGRCGCQMKHSETERAMVCGKCGYTAYPRIMPAVIVGIINGDSLLITRYSKGYAHNALVAGFTEIGETAEETVSREVMEEAGIKVKNIRYYKTQPWGMANDLLIGYFCEVDGDTTLKPDTDELKYAQWVKRDEIELQPDDISLTNEMMKMFRDGKI